MSYAGSIHSTTGSIATYARRLAQTGRPDVDISLDNHAPNKTYTTLDPISGSVSITASHAARFDEIRITLEGCAKTWVENLAPTSTKSRMTATHTFLRLVMPVKESDYPQPRIAEAGRTYTFPFNFAIPTHLLPKACNHQCSGDHVKDAHMQLPPSMGDRDVCPQDDLAPEMAKLQYAVKVQVTRVHEQDGKEIVLVEGKKKIRVIPAVPEAPPMSLGEGFDEYVLSKTKSLKKGVFSGKLGKITVSAEQTSALVLPAPESDPNSSSPSSPAGTMATLHLRFDPHGSAEPPRLGGLTTKIRSTTFYACRPSTILPTSITNSVCFEPARGVYETSTPLSSRCVEAVTWTRQTCSRRNSDSSTSSSECSDSPASPSSSSSDVYYTATILVPITLPSSKTWVPTFHSCIVSRIYALALSLTIHTPATGIPASTVSLHLPVQIAAKGHGLERPALTAAEAAAELADADAFMVPRTLEIPREELVGNSVLGRQRAEEPPSYEAFGVQRQVEVGRC